MQLSRRFHLPAILCSLAVLGCELISRPYTTISVCDDGPYILMARTLANTGHIVYNGWAAAMIVAQLYLGAAFIKLFGFSFTIVRMSTLLVSLSLAYILQRTFVRSGITERNATIGTLSFVLAPMYLMLSPTFMSDIIGLLAIILCLYACLRALQSTTDRAAIAWLCFAVLTNATLGTSRQISWLGVLVMVPSTLWMLRSRRPILIAGSAATVVGALFIIGCMEWLKRQPYIITVKPIPASFHAGHILYELARTFIDALFLLLPFTALFLPQIRRSRPRLLAIFSAAALAYILLAIHWRHSPRLESLLEPTQRDWVNAYGIFDNLGLKGTPLVYFSTEVRVFLTVASIGSLFGLIALHLRPRTIPAPAQPSRISLRQLEILLAPFLLAYALSMIPIASAQWLTDRYLFPVVALALIYLVRYYQQRVHQQLPFAAILLVAFTAIYGVASTHNLFSFYRARADLATELRAHGIPDTLVDSGWEENLNVEIEHGGHVNDSRIKVPANSFVPAPPAPDENCDMSFFYALPHIRPLYGISFDPDACYGLAPIAPTHYSRWPASEPGTLYIVYYAPQN